MEPFKITLWQKEGKKADGTTFVSFSNNGNFNGQDCWWNGYRKSVTKKDGTVVEVVEIVIKPKQTPSAREGGLPIPPTPADYGVDNTPLSQIPF